MHRLAFTLFCLLPSKLLAFVPLEPVDVLIRMSDALEKQSFQGSFSYQRSGDFSTYHIWHQAPTDGTKGVIHERLLRLDGPAQEVVRLGEQAKCASANLQDLLPLARYSQPKLNLNALESGYELGFSADSRVAGHDVLVLTLAPRDTHRYAMELYVEPKTNILLKSVLFNEHGQLLERLQFLSFDVGALSAQELIPSHACQSLPEQVTEPLVQQQVSSLTDSSPWHLQWLPPGFHLLQAKNSAYTLSGAELFRFTYTDGLARFSVFLEPLKAEAGEEMQRQLGSTTVLSRRLLRSDGDMMVTVVGEIPAATAERIALSVREKPRP